MIFAANPRNTNIIPQMEEINDIEIKPKPDFINVYNKSSLQQPTRDEIHQFTCCTKAVCAAEGAVVAL